MAQRNIVKMSLVAAALISTAAWSAEPVVSDQWKSMGDKDGIKVFRKEIPDSPIVALRGEAIVEASIAKVTTIVTDTTRMKEWAANIVELREIREVNSHERIEYNHTGTPWPLKDRDFVFNAKSEIHKENQTIKIIMKSVSDAEVPEYKNKIRAELDGSYTLKQLAPDKTLVTVEIHADPKGSIAKWIVNLFQKSWPRKTIEGIRRQSAKADVIENAEVKSTFGSLNQANAF